MDHGFVRLDRSMFTSPAWKTARPFSSFEAFLDLLQRANFRTRQFRLHDRFIPLNPGDLISTLPKLSETWGWPPDEVKRWLRALADGHVLAGKNLDGLVKISLDAYCVARFVKLPDPSRARKDLLLSSPSSSEEKKEHSSELSSLPSSDTFSVEEEHHLEQKTKEDILFSSLSEERSSEDVTDTRAREPGMLLVNAIIESLAKPKPASDPQSCIPRRESCPEFLHRETEFPPEFPLDEFRRYVDAALRNPDPKLRPKVRRGWIAELRDRFLAERTAEQGLPTTSGCGGNEAQAA